eukprot:579379_1
MAQPQTQSILTAPTLSFEPTVTETHRTLSLLPIVDQLDKYPDNTVFNSNVFTLDDLTFTINLYPHGSNSQSDIRDKVGLYLSISNVKPNDQRKVHVSVMRDDTILTGFVRALPVFLNGGSFGWPTIGRLTHSELKKNPTIRISVKLIHDPLFTFEPTSQTLELQQEYMHFFSTYLGDITLVVKLPEFTDDLSAPPKQKRRLNDPNRCEVCDKEFQSKKALTSHQSNKRDQAHKDYKNKNNDNVNSLDTECNEIKVSSVILRSASKVFNRMLSTNMIERQQQRIEVQAKTLEDVKDMVYYMSTNKLKKTSNALNVIQLAHYYGMDRLFWACASRLLHNLSVQNFVQTIKTFDAFEITNGYDSLVGFAKTNAKEIEKADDFDSLSHSFKCVVMNKSN